MKTKIVRNVPKGRIRSHLPARLRERLVAAALTDSSYTILLFRMRQRVILSGTVEEALTTFEFTEPLVAAGPCFTLEALKLLEAKKALVLTVSDYPWTDTSYVDIHTTLGTHRPLKAPSDRFEEVQTGNEVSKTI